MKLKAVKQKAVIRTHFIDEAGLNKVHTKSTDKRITIWLQLRAEGGRKRKIGVVTKSTKTLFITRNRAKHLMRNGNAYGFNRYILETAKLFNKINLKDDIQKWEIPVKYIIDNGYFLQFKKEGYEVQQFVSLQQLKQFETKPTH